MTLPDALRAVHLAQQILRSAEDRLGDTLATEAAEATGAAWEPHGVDARCGPIHLKAYPSGFCAWVHEGSEHVISDTKPTIREALADLARRLRRGRVGWKREALSVVVKMMRGWR